MQKVLDTYAKSRGVDKGELRFLSRYGDLIYGRHTPKMLELDDLEKIDCMEAQVSQVCEGRMA